MLNTTYSVKAEIGARKERVLDWLHDTKTMGFTLAEDGTAAMTGLHYLTSQGPAGLWRIKCMAVVAFPSTGLLVDAEHRLLGITVHSEWTVDHVRGREGDEVCRLDQRVAVKSPALTWWPARIVAKQLLWSQEYEDRAKQG